MPNAQHPPEFGDGWDAKSAIKLGDWQDCARFKVAKDGGPSCHNIALFNRALANANFDTCIFTFLGGCVRIVEKMVEEFPSDSKHCIDFKVQANSTSVLVLALGNWAS